MSVYARVAGYVLWLLALLLASASTAAAEHLVEEAELGCRGGQEGREDDEEGCEGPHFGMMNMRFAVGRSVGCSAQRCVVDSRSGMIVIDSLLVLELKHCWQLSISWVSSGRAPLILISGGLRGLEVL